MKTHMSNTKSIQIYTDYWGKNTFAKHQQHMHSQKIKPLVDTRRPKSKQYKVLNNNKVQINQQPLQHVNQLFKKITESKYKSTIDNKVPSCYQNGKKILKDKVKKSPKQNYLLQEHERQLRSQAQRIKNCKSINQRKKDNCDPIVNTIYLMRDGKSANQVTIEGFKKSVLGRNRPASAVPVSRANKNVNVKYEYDDQAQTQQHYGTNYSPIFHTNVPDLSQNTNNPHNKSIRPQSAIHKTNPKVHNQQTNWNTQDLPECSYKQIMDHIIMNKIYRDADIKVLYVRMAHKYGEQELDQIWDIVMDQLHS